jgi:hypothetical protein
MWCQSGQNGRASGANTGGTPRYETIVPEVRLSRAHRSTRFAEGRANSVQLKHALDAERFWKPSEIF